MYSIYTVSQKNIPPLNCLLLCQILIDFQNFCTAGKRMKFAITAIVWPLSRLWPLFTVIEQRPDVHPWARFAGSCHSSSSPSIHCRVATVTTVAAVHRDQPIAWRPSVSSLCRQLPLLLVPLTPLSCGHVHRDRPMAWLYHDSNHLPPMTERWCSVNIALLSEKDHGHVDHNRLHSIRDEVIKISISLARSTYHCSCLRAPSSLPTCLPSHAHVSPVLPSLVLASPPSRAVWRSPWQLATKQQLTAWPASLHSAATQQASAHVALVTGSSRWHL